MLSTTYLVALRRLKMKSNTSSPAPNAWSGTNTTAKRICGEHNYVKGEIVDPITVYGFVALQLLIFSTVVFMENIEDAIARWRGVY